MCDVFLVLIVCVSDIFLALIGRVNDIFLALIQLESDVFLPLINPLECVYFRIRILLSSVAISGARYKKNTTKFNTRLCGLNLTSWP